MVWVDSISQLDFYNPTTVDAECYCETLLDPTDIWLQANLGTLGTDFVFNISALTPDGNTLIEVVNPENYTIDVVLYGGVYYGNIKFKRFSEALCNNPCFILQVRVSVLIQRQQLNSYRVVFDKYTQRYCIDSCCLIPSGITVQTGQEGQLQEYSELDYSDEYYNIS